MEPNEIRVGRDGWTGAIANVTGHQIVVAGPGTGKTEFLVRRVAHLVNEGHARRDRILVLCFSRRAAADLKNRVDAEIGVTGLPVDVTTFHSLALRLIERTNLDGTRPRPLTTPEQTRLVAQLLRGEDPARWPLTYRGILDTAGFATEVADFLMRCSERLLTPDDVAGLAEDRPDWRGISGLYQRYLATLASQNRTDYGVMLADAVTILRGSAGQDAVSHFDFVVVDEYQDTSPAQAEMAALAAARSGNLTVAGDPYQSIYSFRGAEVRNVSRFSEDHPGATRYVLSESFRVPTEILEGALRVVSSGELPGGTGPVSPAAHKGRVEAHVFDQETAEAEWIAREVEQAMLVDEIPATSIAVLVRSKRELVSELSRALSRRSVPHHPPDSRLVDHPAVVFVSDLVAVARRAGSPPSHDPTEAADSDRAMRRVLLGPLLRIPLGLERDIFRERRRSADPWHEVLARLLPGRPGLIELVSDPAWALDGAAADGFWHVWQRLDDLDLLVLDPERADWREAWSSFSQVLARQGERDPGLSLATFFDLSEDEDFEPTPLLTHHRPRSGVTLTTLHQAKGLEFDVVFIANATEGVFPDLRRSRRMLRPELLSPERTTDAAAQHLFQLQEEMRLAYTAMTRARLRVIWTATDAGIDEGQRRPSRFMLAASGADGLEDLGPPPPDTRDPVTVSEAEISLRRELMTPASPVPVRLASAAALAANTGAHWDPSAFAGVSEPGPASPILEEGPTLSPSQAEAYKACPRRYALERRLHLGDASSPYAHFGTLVHAALERAEREVAGSGEAHNVLERALACLDEVWEGADFGTPELDEAWLAKARATLTHLYENWPTPDGAPILLEHRVEAEIGGVPWVGFIDRVEQVGDGVRVVDYKTGGSAMTIDDAAVSVQLAFYATALIAEGHDVIDAQLWYPRVKNKSMTTRALDLTRLDERRSEMVEITSGVLAERWAPQVGDHCARCIFRLSCPAWPEGRGAYLP